MVCYFSSLILVYGQKVKDSVAEWGADSYVEEFVCDYGVEDGAIFKK